MTTLEKICAEVLEKAKKASPRPWGKACAVAGRFIEDGEIYEKLAACGPEHREGDDDGYEGVIDDSAYLSVSANNAEKLARACLIMRTALDNIPSHAPLCPEGEGDWGCCDDARNALEALQKVEEILK